MEVTEERERCRKRKGMSSSSHKKFGVISIINVIIDLCNKYFWSGVAAAEGKEEENKTKLARARGMTQEMRRVRCRLGK